MRIHDDEQEVVGSDAPRTGSSVIMLIVWLVAVTILPCVLVSLHAFDRLVLIERTRFEDAWLRDGKPHPLYLSGGLNWERTFRTGLASQRCSWSWSSSRPNWVKADGAAVSYHRRLQTCWAISAAALAVLLVAVLVGAALR